MLAGLAGLGWARQGLVALSWDGISWAGLGDAGQGVVGLSWD
jgi:hypothetical protein